MQDSDQNYIYIGSKPLSARVIRRRTMKLTGFLRSRNKGIPHPMKGKSRDDSAR